MSSFNSPFVPLTSKVALFCRHNWVLTLCISWYVTVLGVLIRLFSGLTFAIFYFSHLFCMSGKKPCMLSFPLPNKRASLVAQMVKAGDLGLTLGTERSLREGNGYPLQYSCLENPIDGGAWWAEVKHDWVTRHACTNEE